MEAPHKVKLVADFALFASRSVLFVRYTDTNKYDHQSGWFLPDDLLTDREHPKAAAQRILADQIGTEKIELELADIESFTGNDGTWHLVFHYRADLDSRPKLDLSSDIAEAIWFDLDSLPDQSEVAHHGWALLTIRSMQQGD